MREITLRELQLFSLEIMKDIHKFCENNGIEYSLLDGSLIGAIRHQGFIPWDDDIDIVMRRPDFERFCKTYKSDEYQLKYRGNGQDCMVPFARVYDVKRTVIKTTAPWCLDEVGVWVDVMPADNVIDDVEQFGKYYDESRKLWLRSASSRTAYAPFLRDKSLKYNFKLLIKKILFLNGRRTDHYLLKVMNRASAMPWGSTAYWGQLTSMGDNIKGHHRMEIFDHTVLKSFEDTQFYVMNGYDKYLRDNYKDYMQLPPENKRVPHYADRTKFFWKDETSEISK